MSGRAALAELRRVLLLLEQPPLKAVLAPDVIDYLGRRWRDPGADGVPGYSDGEGALRHGTASVANQMQIRRFFALAQDRHRAGASH
jgi:hypothetical protein